MYFSKTMERFGAIKKADEANEHFAYLVINLLNFNKGGDPPYR
jgi:hypothetical protein